ncbi:MAG: hypothetical protein GF381_02970 [Candidatus Pacebacteria bacterium]|nr:hypothetical protein [Candidatus Paceibacterota bacterium]
MSIFKNILQILEESDISYKLIEHEPVFTMEQAAQVCNHLPKQGVKTLLIKLYATKRQFEYRLIVWQGNEQMPFAEICSKLDFKKCKLAQPQEVADELGIEVGALSPFGCAKQYPVIFDKRLLEQKQVFINAGVHDKTIAFAPEDLFKIVAKSSSQCIQF